MTSIRTSSMRMPSHKNLSKCRVLANLHIFGRGGGGLGVGRYRLFLLKKLICGSYQLSNPMQVNCEDNEI